MSSSSSANMTDDDENVVDDEKLSKMPKGAQDLVNAYREFKAAEKFLNAKVKLAKNKRNLSNDDYELAPRAVHQYRETYKRWTDLCNSVCVANRREVRKVCAEATCPPKSPSFTALKSRNLAYGVHDWVCTADVTVVRSYTVRVSTKRAGEKRETFEDSLGDEYLCFFDNTVQAMKAAAYTAARNKVCLVDCGSIETVSSRIAKFEKQFLKKLEKDAERTHGPDEIAKVWFKSGPNERLMVRVKTAFKVVHKK